MRFVHKIIEHVDFFCIVWISRRFFATKSSTEYFLVFLVEKYPDPIIILSKIFPYAVLLYDRAFPRGFTRLLTVLGMTFFWAVLEVLFKIRNRTDVTT